MAAFILQSFFHGEDRLARITPALLAGGRASEIRRIDVVNRQRRGGAGPRFRRLRRRFRLRFLFLPVLPPILRIAAFATFTVVQIAVTMLIAFAVMSITVLMVLMSMVIVFLPRWNSLSWNKRRRGRSSDA